MGSDEDVERAARVSYGHGTRKTSQTRGLIRYLRRHHHTTPSEMVELKFHCVMPIFVARQWIRHRTACLAEGTEIYFDLPSGIRRRGNQLCSSASAARGRGSSEIEPPARTRKARQFPSRSRS